MQCVRPLCLLQCVHLRRLAPLRHQIHAQPAWHRSCQQPLQRRRRLRAEVCRAGEKRSNGDEAFVGVDPSTPLAAAHMPWTQTWQAKGAAAALLLFVVARLLGSLQRRRPVSDLETRGYLDDARDNEDPYLEDIMRNMNTVQYEELSEEQIAAARKRRARGVMDGRKRPTDIEIPDNHPFAVKKELSREEEELVRKRLDVKRGLPLQDLGGRRGFPGDGGGAEPAAQ